MIFGHMKTFCPFVNFKAMFLLKVNLHENLQKPLQTSNEKRSLFILSGKPTFSIVHPNF